MGAMSGSKKKTVFVGMSGGVDSSVTAYLLKKQGYNAVGVFMRCYNVDGCAERDAEDARRAAEHIGIPFYVWDFEGEYKKRVVEYMIEGYRAGLTPNPDVMCNREVKFGLFLRKALKMGADYVATGHYVQIKKARGAYRLYRAKDRNKDQSYFLWTLTQKELKHCLFPVGAHTKPQVRAIARRAGLPNAAKKDSQGICFLGQVSIADFLSAYIPARKGHILTPAGEVIGEHGGAQFLTVGQRHVGAAVRVSKGGETKPHYVVAKDVRKNTVTVAEGRENPLLFKKSLRLVQVNLIAPARGKKVQARVRYRQPVAAAELQKGGKGWRLKFLKPQQFVAEGQSAVWYSARGEMLGGGVISLAK